jgi:hypothetical protein
MKTSTVTTQPKPGLHLTSPVLAAAGEERWDPTAWETTALKARAAGLLRKIAKLQCGTPSAHATGPATIQEAEQRLAALLARTRQREDIPQDEARDRAFAQSERNHAARVRAAKAWLARLGLRLAIGGR